MGVYTRPNIVTNGLILNLDALNKKSYPGSGTIWNNLSSTTISGSLFNNPTLTTDAGNSLSFSSAASQYGTVVNPGDLSNWTAETFVKFNSSYSTKVSMVIGGQYNGSNKLNFTIGTNNAPINYNIAVGFFDGAWRSTTGVAYPVGAWVYITGTYDGSVVRQYTNGLQAQTLNYTGTPSSGGELRINRRWDDVVSSGNLFDTNIAVIRVYNRALSAQEVQQNYNALKSRFNLI